MLDPRIYRAALVPVLFALIVAAFSLSDRPRPIGTTLEPDAFSASRALSDLDAWAAAYPARRAGDSGDAALGAKLAATFRAMGSYQVSTPSFEAETADGKRRLTTVIARQVGQPGPGLVVVAHRDALGRGGRAELSGTAAMLELARVVRGGRLKRTVTFVSTSGGSAGLGGARDLARRLPGRPGAVLVLGDLAGQTVRRPFVAGWSTGDGVGSLQLRRTVEAAVRKEAGTNPGGARATSQWARLAFPVTVGEQGPLVAADLPAALLSVSGERSPPADDPIVRNPPRLQPFGRAALRTLTALDNTPTLGHGGSSHALVTLRKVLPVWAVRLLVAALLLAPALVAVDGFARVRRRHEAVVPWVWWIVAGAAPLALALAFAWLLGVTGLLPATPPEPVAAGAIAVGSAGTVALAAIGLVAVLGWITLRPALLRRAGVRTGGFRGEGAGAALLVTWCALAAVLWVRNPYAAALLVPGAHALLAVIAPEVRLRRGLAVALVVVAAAPFLLVDLSIAGQLGLSPADFGWFCLLLVAGGVIGPLGWAIWSLVLACLVAALLVALRSRPSVAPEETPEITVRGPVSYAGPGSLGGTESALRR
jgi:Peptidase family M28